MKEETASTDGSLDTVLAVPVPAVSRWGRVTNGLQKHHVCEAAIYVGRAALGGWLVLLLCSDPTYLLSGRLVCRSTLRVRVYLRVQARV